jgi:hypothetical protein
MDGPEMAEPGQVIGPAPGSRCARGQATFSEEPLLGEFEEEEELDAEDEEESLELEEAPEDDEPEESDEPEDVVPDAVVDSDFFSAEGVVVEGFLLDPRLSFR